MTRQHCILKNAHFGAHLMIGSEAPVLLGDCTKVITFCEFPGCKEPSISDCDCCRESTYFCSDHGSAGGDHEGGDNANGSPYGAYAVPSACWKCGGYNADAE